MRNVRRNRILLWNADDVSLVKPSGFASDPIARPLDRRRPSGLLNLEGNVNNIPTRSRLNDLTVAVRLRGLFEWFVVLLVSLSNPLWLKSPLRSSERFDSRVPTRSSSLCDNRFPTSSPMASFENSSRRSFLTPAGLSL